MQIVIELDKDLYKVCQELEGIHARDVLTDLVIDSVARGIVLPEHPINGDMIRLAFGESRVYGEYATGEGSKTCMCLDGIIPFDDEWWNAPYKRGDIDADSN